MISCLRLKSCEKFKSESGVSILFGLLVLLVCGVIAAVILTAATAAGGRAADLEKMDQRYYSVRSAADILSETLGTKTLTVDRYQLTTTETGKDDVSQYLYVFTPGTGELDFLLNDAAMSFVFGQKVPAGLSPVYADYSAASPGNWMTDSNAGTWFERTPLTSEVTRELDLTHGALTDVDGASPLGKAGANSKFNVAVTEILRTDGSLDFALCNDNGDKDKYCLEFSLKATVSDNTDTQVLSNEENIDPVSGTAMSKKVTLTKKSTVIQWQPGEIKKVK